MELDSFFKRQRLVIILSVMAIVLGTIGVTYAVFTQIYAGEEPQIVKAGDLSIVFAEGNTINEDMLPISNTEGLAQSGYQFRITNDGTLDATFKIYIKNGTTHELSHDQLYISINNSTPKLLSEFELENNKRLIETGKIKVGDYKDYIIKIWIREDASTDIVNKNINLIIDVESIVTELTLSDMILDQYGGESAIQELPMSTFANVADSQTTSGLFKMADDYGTSYYFRGHRDYVNNNVIFAGFQWKIIRINGDGSIRMIYNGTEQQYIANGYMVNTTGTNTQISTSAYNSTRDDNTYVGYKYGQAGATTYNAAHSNTTNSTIKTVVDTWYANNIANKGTTIIEKIVDRIFCNDREKNTTAYQWNTSDTALGYGTNYTLYAAYNRLNTNKTPKLTCSQTNDQYTVASGKLTNPVGLITADEVSIAGGANGLTNSLYFLYTNEYYWTFSPLLFNGSDAIVFYVYSGGYLTNGPVNSARGVRPVINLASTVTMQEGNGTSTNPYRIS